MPDVPNPMNPYGGRKDDDEGPVFSHSPAMGAISDEERLYRPMRISADPLAKDNGVNG